MRVLLLGGTVFVGRAIAEDLVALGHDVTTFSRGISGEPVPGATAIHGDRTVDADLLRLAETGPWDAIVDTSGYEPEVVAASARLLPAKRYLFISSASAFASWPAQPIDESSPLLDFDPSARSYGASKAESERVLAAELGSRLSVLYPGIIVGPRENVGRLTWWLSRLHRGGDVLVPYEARAQVRVLDVRDLAAFAVLILEIGVTGRYLVAGPEAGTLLDWLHLALATVDSDATLIAVGDATLLAAGIEPWSELPLWAPVGQGVDAAWALNTGAAERAGLVLSPPERTVAQTWEWMRSIGADVRPELLSTKPGIGIEPGRETAVIEAIEKGATATS